MQRAQLPVYRLVRLLPVGLRVRVAPSEDDSEEMPDLLPLHPLEDDDAQGPLDNDTFADDLDVSALEGSSAWEDDAETPLDVGVEISDVGDVSLPSEATEIVLDIGQLINEPKDQTPCALDDERGPALPPSYDELGETPETDDVDPEDGLDESVETLVSEALPGLDADAGEDLVSYLGSEEIGTADRDDPLPPVAALPWTERRIDASLGAMSSVAVSGDHVVAGGRHVCWLDRCLKLTHRVAMPSARVVDLACPGAESDTDAICASATGEVYVATRHGDRVVRTDQWRAVAGVRNDEAATLSLCASPQHSGVLGHTSNGRLIRSQDGGMCWSRVELHGRVVRLSAGASPAVALLETRGRRRLMLSHDTGLNWRALEMDAGATPALGEDDVLVAATGSTVAVAHPSRGLWVCTDGGPFFRVPGCAGVTALTAGAPLGREYVWLSVLEEVARRSHIVMVDARGRDATRIALVQAVVDEDSNSDNAADHCRVSALTWEASDRLWAAGDFGLTRFSCIASPVAAS